EICLDQRCQKYQGVHRVGRTVADMVGPELLQPDVAVSPPLLLEQLHGAVHAIEPARQADRSGERLHSQSPGSASESCSFSRNRCTLRMFQPVCSAMSQVE